MEHAISADGTRIAYARTGDGPVVVIVNGAFSTARDAAEIADELAHAGLTAVAYDRRARGDSGDTHPFAPEREAEDLIAVIEAASGSAAVLGHSSGAVLALFATSLGAPITRLFLSEPPFHFGEDEPAADLPERLQALVDEGRTEEAVVTFQLEGIGLDPGMVEQIKTSPLFDALTALAQSTVYDASLTRQVSDPTPAMRAVAAPITVLSGAQTFPFLRAASERLAAMLPSATFVEVPESVGHRIDPAATTRIVARALAT